MTSAFARALGGLFTARPRHPERRALSVPITCGRSCRRRDPIRRIRRASSTIGQTGADRLPSPIPPALAADLFRKADAARWGLAPDEFTAVVDACVDRGFAGGGPSRREMERHLDGLHLADLALAAACALGRDAAWDHFVLVHRPLLYRAADALDPAGGAREIADSLYAELFGVRGRMEERRSLFHYFHGRSSLATWLRAVLAQRYVDARRALRRDDPLPDDDRALPEAAATGTDPDRALLVPLVENALRHEIDALPARDRLRLRSYYVSGLTLAGIGRITGEHEATVSRHLARTRRGLRDGIARRLREEARLTSEQVARAVELAVDDPGSLDLEQAFGTDRKEPPRDRSR